MPFETETWARTALLGLGAAVEVLAPAQLREAVSAEASRTAARYADSG